ncbi:hypothetical protein CE195_10055 [Sodalis-like symbiont of Philaenus spumarius]|nr:hypothetical protein CE195_12585 [Sodalis-like symbiont of Philaenus spumarius]OZI14241.1 hypothetical protein CE195_10055 [Sodalis-like symbiont of Philaenus spumarius]
MTGKISITAAGQIEKDAMGRISLTVTVAGERQPVRTHSEDSVYPRTSDTGIRLQRQFPNEMHDR